MTPSTTRRRRTFVIGFVVIVTIGLITRSRMPKILSFADDVAHLDGRLVIAGLALSLAAIVNRGLMNRAAHRALVIDATSSEMTRTAAVAFGAQKLVKSAGTSGLAVFIHHGRRRGRAASQITGACSLVAMASFVALGIAMASMIAVLASSGRLTGWWLLAGLGFGVYGVTLAALLALLVRHRSLLHRAWIGGHRMFCRIVRRPRPAVPAHVIDDLMAAFATA